MRYLVIPLLILVAINPLSYAKYNWDRKNRLGAAGAFFIAAAAVIIPAVLLLIL